MINKKTDQTEQAARSRICDDCGCQLNRVVDVNDKIYLIGKHADFCKSKNAKIKFEIYNEGPKYPDFSFINRLPNENSGGPKGGGGEYPPVPKKAYDKKIIVRTRNPEYINNVKKCAVLYNNRTVTLDDGTDLRPIFPQLYDPDFKKVEFEDNIVCLKCEIKPRDVFFNIKKGYVRLIARYGVWNEKIIGVYIKMLSENDNNLLKDIVKNRLYSCREIFVISNIWKVTNWSNKDIDFTIEAVLPNNAMRWPVFI